MSDLVVCFSLAFILACFGAMGGVTGAFLLLPFQISFLGVAPPVASATNFVYNILAIPNTVRRYHRERRVHWGLALVITAGSLPGMALGYFLRMRFLADPASFKPFVGLVLLGLALLVIRSMVRDRSASKPPLDAGIGFYRMALNRISCRFGDREYGFDPRLLFAVALLVGVVGGAYGIGGGAMLAPFCISVLGLPVHLVAGASLFGTWVSSIIGVGVYVVGGILSGRASNPDLLLGIVFGIGGMAGGSLGARAQKHVPARPIKIGLVLVMLLVALRYLGLPVF